jgi:hypothetical protein
MSHGDGRTDTISFLCVHFLHFAQTIHKREITDWHKTSISDDPFAGRIDDVLNFGLKSFRCDAFITVYKKYIMYTKKGYNFSSSLTQTFFYRTFLEQGVRATVLGPHKSAVSVLKLGLQVKFTFL